jgi:hypothetical protein
MNNVNNLPREILLKILLECHNKFPLLNSLEECETEMKLVRDAYGKRVSELREIEEMKVKKILFEPFIPLNIIELRMKIENCEVNEIVLYFEGFMIKIDIQKIEEDFRFHFEIHGYMEDDIDLIKIKEILLKNKSFILDKNNWKIP